MVDAHGVADAILSGPNLFKKLLFLIGEGREEDEG